MHVLVIRACLARSSLGPPLEHSGCVFVCETHAMTPHGLNSSSATSYILSGNPGTADRYLISPVTVTDQWDAVDLAWKTSAAPKAHTYRFIYWL